MRSLMTGNDLFLLNNSPFLRIVRISCNLSISKTKYGKFLKVWDFLDFFWRYLGLGWKCKERRRSCSWSVIPKLGKEKPLAPIDAANTSFLTTSSFLIIIVFWYFWFSCIKVVYVIGYNKRNELKHHHLDKVQTNF